LNVVLGTLTCFFVYAIGRHAYGEAVGLLAAGFLAVFPSAVYVTSATLSEVPLTCLLAGTIYAFLVWTRDSPRPPAWCWLVLGLMLGAATLIRTIALPFLAVFVVVWLLASGLRRETFKRALLTAVGLTLALAPWVIRNQLVLGGPILLETGGAYTLFNTHSPIADGTHSRAMNRLRDQVFPEYAELPRTEKEVAMSKAQLRYAVRYMLTRPRHELSLIPKRLYHLYRDDQWVFQWLLKMRRDPSSGKRKREVMDPHREARWRGIADVYFFVILALAALGFVMALGPSRRRGLVVPLSVAYFNVAHATLVCGTPRYHAPFVPILAAVALLAACRGDADPTRASPTSGRS
jgi:4-amino-4-deoxy-L-arabinose transferase-like glycosyltransferase